MTAPGDDYHATIAATQAERDQLTTRGRALAKVIADIRELHATWPSRHLKRAEAECRTDLHRTIAAERAAQAKLDLLTAGQWEKTG